MTVLANAQSQLAGFHAPHVDWKAMSPLLAVLGGSVVVLMAGLVSGRRLQRALPAALAIVSLLAAIGLTIWIWDPGRTRPVVAGALSMDTLTLGITVLVSVAGIATVLLSLRSVRGSEFWPGEYGSLVLASIGGM